MSNWKKWGKKAVGGAIKVAPYLNPVTAVASVVSEVTTGKSLLDNAKRLGAGAQDVLDTPKEAALIVAEEARRVGAIQRIATEEALKKQEEASALGLLNYQQVGDKAISELRAGGKEAVGTLQRFGREAVSEIENYGGRAVSGLEAQQARVRDVYDPYQKDAGAAFRKQQALSGALGPDAQRQAYEEFTESPGVAFLREQGMRGLESKAATTGRAGGTRLKAISEFNQGLALQDFQNQFARLGTVTNTQLEAAGNMTARTGALEQARAKAFGQTGQAVGRALQQTGGDVSRFQARTAENLASQIARTGELIGAEQIGLGTRLANTGMAGVGLQGQALMNSVEAKAAGDIAAAQMKLDIFGQVVGVGGQIAAASI